MNRLAAAVVAFSSVIATSASSAAQTEAGLTIAPIQVRPAEPTVLVVDMEGERASLAIFDQRRNPVRECQTRCELELAPGRYTVEVRRPFELSQSIGVEAARTNRFVVRRASVGVGWILLLVGGAGLTVFGGFVASWAAESGRSGGVGGGLGAGFLGFAAGSLFLCGLGAMIPSIVGLARSEGASVRPQVWLSSVDALRSRRVALMNASAHDRFAMAPAFAPIAGYSIAF
ncbi:MAG: hypothetical protein JNK05_40710 [Myxococcales bacterium]|nr:hypothetical protein [Myxococcales bacterium]